MSYCPYCGRQVSDDMSFCPGCGAALNSEIKSYTVDTAVSTGGGNYKIYIASLGSAGKSQVIDLLEDVLGYTTTSAANLVNNIPVQIAGSLSLKQAAIVAQAFEEYGVELTVTNNDEYEDISSSTSGSSIFNSDGSFLASAAIVLATLGAANRLRSINKPKSSILCSIPGRNSLSTSAGLSVPATWTSVSMSLSNQEESSVSRSIRATAVLPIIKRTTASVLIPAIPDRNRHSPADRNRTTEEDKTKSEILRSRFFNELPLWPYAGT